MRKLIVAAVMLGTFGCVGDIHDPGGPEPDITGIYCLARLNSQMVPVMWGDVQVVGGLLHVFREGGAMNYTDRLSTRTAEGEEAEIPLTGKTLSTVEPAGIDEYYLETMLAVAGGDSLVLRLKNSSDENRWTYRRGTDPCW